MVEKRFNAYYEERTICLEEIGAPARTPCEPIV
jgi:hypothetical protein